MTPKTASTALVCALTLCATALPTQAQDRYQFGIETGVSSLGLFVAPDIEMTRNLHLRTPLYFGSYSGNVEYEGNDGDGEIDITSVAVVGDYYIANSGFRVSGGVSFGGYEMNATYVNPTLDGRTYNGTIDAFVEQDNDIVPVLAVGYRHMFRNNWGLVAEAGVRITSLDLTTEGEDGLPPTQQADFNDDIREINEDLDDVPVLPFVSIGLSYRF